MELDDRLTNAESINLKGNSEYFSSLCIYHADIDIQNISKLLGIEPTKAQRRGDLLGKKQLRPAKVGLWYLNAPEDLSFSEQLEYLLGKTTSKQETWDTLSLEHRMELRCYVSLHSWTDGFEIPNTMMNEIGKRHWKFGFSMYSAEGDEIVEAFLKPAFSPPEEQ